MLDKVLAAVRRELPDPCWPVLVVDSSGDGAAAAAASPFAGVKVLEVTQRMWAGAARNLGAAELVCEALLFLDADCIPQAGWGPLVLAASGRKKLVQAGAVTNGTPTSLAGTLMFWSEFSEFTSSGPPGERSFAPSFQMLVQRDWFLGRGGFPKESWIAEDLLFSHRLTQENVPVYFDPALVVDHLNRQEWGAVFTHIYRVGKWSGCTRRICPEMRGAFFRKVPLLIPLLVPLRWWGVVRRLWRDQRETWFRKIAVSALVVPAMVCWSTGFARGICFGAPGDSP